MKKGVYVTLVCLLVAAFAASALYLGNYFLEGKRQADRYNELSNVVTQARQEAAESSAATEPTATTQESTEPETTQAPSTEAATEPTEAKMLPGYDTLYEENHDLVGWIRIENSPMNYPVMQTSKDNANYYLYKNFDKEPADRGSIYAREECNVFDPSDNITLFGHNMKDGSMFAYLGEYYEKETWQNNSLIFFDTLYEYHVYKIFAVFKTTASADEGFRYHQMVNAGSAKEFNDFIATCKRLSFYDTGITPVYGDKIICLSTCEYTLDNGRFVVAAVRIS